MGKPERKDLGGVTQDRQNKTYSSSPKYVPSQKFNSNPLGANITRQVALGSLKGVNIVDPSTDDVLAFDGINWIATAESGAGSGITLPATLPVNAIGTATTSLVIDLSETSAHVHTMTLATNTTLSFLNIPSQHLNFEIDVTQDGTGGWDLLFDTASAVIEGTPSVQQSASKQTVLIGQTHGTTTSTSVFDIFDTALKSGSGALGHTAVSWSTFDAITTIEAASFAINEIERLIFREGGNLISSAADLTMNFQVTTGGIFDWFAGQQKYMELSRATYFVQLVTDSSYQLLMREGLQRMTMDNTNTIFQLADLGSFSVQSSDAATSFISVKQDGVIVDIALTVTSDKAVAIADSIFFGDAESDPTVSGEVRRNADDLIVFTGGTTKNLSDIGAAADNLGDHTATEDLVMSSFSVTEVVDIRFNAGTMAIKSSTSELSIHVATDQSFQLINRDGLQRMTMAATNTIFQNADSGAFVIQTSDAVTSMFSLTDSQLTLDVDVILANNQIMTLNESLLFLDSGITPSVTGEIRLVDNTDIVAFSGGATRNFSNIPNATTLEMGGAVINAASGTIYNDDLEFHVAAGSGNWRLPANDVMQWHINSNEVFNFNDNLALMLVDTSFGGNWIGLSEMTAPTAAGTNNARIFVDNGGAGGKSRLMVIFQAGAAQVLALEP